jgi:hypothetical protein
MLTKNSFSPEEWAAVRDLPHLVGFAALVAGSSGLGTLKESMAIAKSMIEGQASDQPLVRELTNRAEMQDAQKSVRATLGSPDAKIDSPARLRGLALERVTAGMATIDAKGSPDESSALRQWLYGLADKVTKAAKEGGFLGFGGTRVSEDEQAFLSDLRKALHIQVGSA